MLTPADLIDRIEATFKSCAHPYIMAESDWCNVCGAMRFGKDSPWFYPHWRDVIARAFDVGELRKIELRKLEVQLEPLARQAVIDRATREKLTLDRRARLEHLSSNPWPALMIEALGWNLAELWAARWYALVTQSLNQQRIAPSRGPIPLSFLECMIFAPEQCLEIDRKRASRRPYRGAPPT
jgi:hypothetical protein